MKDFKYYSQYTAVSKYGLRKLVYSEAKFNPDEIDSKSEERRIREELEEKMERLYRERIELSKKLGIEFKKDLFEEFDVQDNPKAEKLYSLVWETSDTFEEAYNEFERLVDLIKD